jgi:hypothetical protein
MRMKDQAARVCRSLCCTRVIAEIHKCRGTRLEDHLKLVLSIIDRAERRAALQVSRSSSLLHWP